MMGGFLFPLVFNSFQEILFVYHPDRLHSLNVYWPTKGLNSFILGFDLAFEQFIAH